MKLESQIDETLRVIGNAPAPSGLERRINAKLDAPRWGFSVGHALSAIAVAASVSLAMFAMSPSLRELALHSRAGYLVSPRIMAHPLRSFGGASAVHIPAAPVPVQPTPVTQGRGHARSGRIVLPGSTRTVLPRGVALPAGPQTRVFSPPDASPSSTNPGQQ